MKSYQLRSAGPAEPFSTRLRPGGLSRARAGLLLLLAFGLCLAFLLPAFAADGDLDPSFITGSGQYTGVQTIPEIRGQAGYKNGFNDTTPWPYNGRTLLYGTFNGVQVGDIYPPYSGGNSNIARLAADGTLDTTFNINGTNNYQINGEIRGVFIYPHDYPVTDLQDKILVWGRFNAGSGSTYYSNLARLNADGSLDITFPHLNSWGGAVNTVAVQGGGLNGTYGGTTDKLLVGGFNLKAGSEDMGPTYQLVRLDYLGYPDSPNIFTPWGAPNGYIYHIKIVSDPIFGNNNVLIFCSYPKNQNGTGGTYYMLLVNSTVPLPSTSAPLAFIGDEKVDGPIFNMAQQSGGELIIVGTFKNVNDSATSTPHWVSRNHVARFNVDGSLDANYPAGAGPNGMVTQISPMSSSDNKMVLSGSFTNFSGTNCGYIVRLTETGLVDASFTAGADDLIQNLNWNSDGSGGTIYGYFRSYDGQPRGGIAGLGPDGNITNSFSNVTARAGWPGMVWSLAAQRDGKIIIGGDFNGVGGRYRGGIARINPDGSLDTSFKGGVDGYVQSVAVQSDDKILLGGNLGWCNGYPCTSLARLNPNGSLDTDFKPMLVGDDNSLNTVNHVLPLSNGRIMIAGDIWNADGGGPLVRLEYNGSLDMVFFNNISNTPNPFPPETQWAWGARVAVMGDNYLLAGGYSLGNYFSAPGFLGRITHEGIIDPNFNPPNTPVAHFQTMDGQVKDLLLQPDGKIVVSGLFSQIYVASGSPPARSGIARFSADGWLDNTFIPNLPIPDGANTIDLAAMARQTNGKILIEENFLNIIDFSVNCISRQVTRLNPDGSLDLGFKPGIPTEGWYNFFGSGSILRQPNGKALIGGCFNDYNGSPLQNEFSLVRIFAGGGSINPSIFLLLLD